MDLTIEQFERIEAYLQGYLTEDKRKEFEVEIVQNPALKEEIETQKQLRLALNALATEQRRIKLEGSDEAIALEQQIKEAYQRYIEPTEQETPSKNPFTFSYTQWATAASVVLMLGFGWFYRAQYYIPSDAIAMTEQELTYKDSALKLSPNSTPMDHVRTSQKALWFAALAELKSKHKKQAKKMLTKIATTNGHPYQEKAKTMLEKL